MHGRAQVAALARVACTFGGRVACWCTAVRDRAASLLYVAFYVAFSGRVFSVRQRRFGRAIEVLVEHLQVVLLRDGLRVAEPGDDDVEREDLHELGLARNQGIQSSQRA